MNILAVHPEDSPWSGPWSKQRWDLVIDFGWAGWSAYGDWARRLGCPVLNIYDTAEEIGDLREVNQLLDEGRRHLVDDEGLDWWEIWSPVLRTDLEVILHMARLAQRIEREAIVLTTRPSLHASALAAFMGTPVRAFPGIRQTSVARRLKKYVRAAATLRPRQFLEIAFDKWDPVYDVRRRLAPARPQLNTPVTLLPSGYANASHAVSAYAAMVPDREFLLVSTRLDGGASRLPSNIHSAVLASYVAPAGAAESAEIAGLVEAWNRLVPELAGARRELAVAAKLGVFASIPSQLSRGIRLRQLWKSVFDAHEIAAVLCGDENNPMARLPLILARGRRIPALSCHHGALDFQPLVKELSADTYVVKGDMERDYLVRTCGVDRTRVFVGAAEEAQGRPAARSTSTFGSVVFFSEPYELQLGRVEELYRDVLPRLCEVAAATGRTLIVKLHPFESRRGRTSLIRSLLTPSQLDRLHIIAGPLTPDLLARTWCAVTVESSVAVECTLHRIPCFLCGWFDVVRQGYLRQYARFGAGVRLDSPTELEQLPALAARHKPALHTARRLRREISRAELDGLLRGYASGASHERCREAV